MSASVDGLGAPGRERVDDELSLAALHAQHYARLVRVAWLLVRDTGRAEELVQDAFVELHRRWPGLRERSTATGYLHATVVNRCRSALRHQAVVRAHPEVRLVDVDSAESDALVRLERRRVLDRLQDLPRRQREVLVLRYYGELSEAEIADALGISRGAVKSHSSRGLAALRPVLGRNA